MNIAMVIRRSIAMLVGIVLAAGVPVASAADNVEAARANLELGVAYLRKNNLPIAKQKLERARDQNPSNATVHTALAMLYERLNQEEMAEAEFKTALRLAPKDPDIHNNYAVYLCRKGRAVEGGAHFEQAAANKLYRTPWAAYTNAGVCLRRAGKIDEAELRFNKALAAKADYSEAVVQLADLELSQKNAGAAYDRIERYLSRNPASADLLLMGWRAAREQKDQANVDRLAKRLQLEFPDTDQARAVGAAKANAG